MKLYFLKHRGKNWWGNMPLSVVMDIGENKLYADYCFYRKKDAQKYLDTKGNSCLEVWSAEVKEDKLDNRKNNF